MVNKSLILAAGLGSRLSYMTESMPKALVKINGVPILKIQLDALINNKISEVNIVCGYKAEMIIEFVNQNYTGSRVKFNFIHNNEYEITNSAYSFSLAYEFIKGNNFIHMNCDNIVTSDLIKKLIKSEHVNCIITRKQKLTDNMEQVSVEGERILKMKNISFKEARLKAMGVAKITPELSEFLFAEISREIEEEERNGNFYGAIRNAIDEFDIFSLNSTENIFEVNDIDQLNEANIVIGEKISS
tara:strand:+ start:202 stop:933 length:732 start_codon:yes stop_codon:yes gene_type:complete